jgi:hypothetical protein
MPILVSPYTGRAKANHCRLMWDNLLEKGTVVASSEDADFPVENCYDWLTFDFFRPAAGGTVTIALTLDNAGSANYFAFYNQDLFKLNGRIKLQYWDGSDWVDATANILPANNAPRAVFFDRKTSDQWRVVVTCSSVFNLGVIAFGEYTALPQGIYLGWTEPQLARAPQLINSESDQGNFLGRSVIANGVATQMVLQYAPDEWVRETWMPFILHAEQKAFFFAHDVIRYPTDCAYLWVPDGNIQPPQHTHYGFMGATFNVKGLVE